MLDIQGVVDYMGNPVNVAAGQGRRRAVALVR